MSPNTTHFQARNPLCPTVRKDGESCRGVPEHNGSTPQGLGPTSHRLQKGLRRIPVVGVAGHFPDSLLAVASRETSIRHPAKA